MKRFLLIPFDVTGLPDDEVDALAGEASVQAEESDPYVPADDPGTDEPQGHRDVPVLDPVEITARDASIIVTALEQREEHWRGEGEDDLADEVARLVRPFFAMEKQAGRPAPGTRVRLTRPVDRYPHFRVDAGATGVVVNTGDPDLYAVLMAQPIDGAEDWDNEIIWNLRDGEQPERDLEATA